MKKWITFDLDGTLMQNPFVGHVFPEIERIVKQQVGRKEKVLEVILSEHTSRIRSNRLVEAYDWDGIVTDYLTERKIELIIEVDKIVCHFCKEPAIYLLEDDVMDVLKRLKMKGYSLAAVTNGYLKYQQPVMDALQLTSLFDLIITPSEAGFAKPDFRIFSGIGGEIVFHVGDRLEDDVRSAYEAGIPSVFINRSLPKEVRDLPIPERNGQSDIEPFLLAKLKREVKKEISDLPVWAKPTYLISSIKELVALLPKNKQ